MHTKSIVLWVTMVGVYLLAQGLGLWHWWGLPRPLDVPFLDMYALLAAADCEAMGLDSFVENPCDHLGRPHVYPRTWLFLRFLGIGRWANIPIGLAMAVVFYTTWVWVVAPKTWGQVGWGLLIGLSPGVILAAERGNFDIGAFALLAIAARATRPWAAWAGVATAAALKFYPLVAMAPLFWLFRQRRRLVVTMALLTVVATLGTGVLWAEDWPKMATTVPAPMARYFTMGAPLLWLHLGVDSPELLGWTAGGLVVAGCTLLGWRSPQNLEQGPARWALVGSVTLVFCFLARTNYDYRWVFLGLCLPGMVATRSWVPLAAGSVSLWMEAAVAFLGNGPLAGNPWMVPIVKWAPILDHAAGWGAIAGVAWILGLSARQSQGIREVTR